MKQTYFLISMLLFVATLFLANEGIAQDYVHYATLRKHVLSVDCLAFSPDSQTLASGGHKELILWDVVTGRHKATLAGHKSSVENIAFSPDGRTLVSNGATGSIYLWDAISGAHLRTLEEDPPIGVDSLVFSPDGHILAAGGYKNEYSNPNPGIIILWDAATGKQKKTLTGHLQGVTSIVFSPDGEMIASGSYDNTIRLWNAVTGENKKILKHPGQGHLSVVFSPDGKTIASHIAQEVRLWDANTYCHKATLTAYNMYIWSIAFSPDSRTLAGGTAFVHLWNASTGELRATLGDFQGMVEHIAFSPDGSTLASGYGIDLWNVVTGEHLQTLRGEMPIFGPKGQIFASSSIDGTIRLWRVSSPQVTNPNLQSTADQVYNNAIRSVMWIVNPGISEGSGVLIDKKFKLAITNAHVTGTQNIIEVYFPAPDENGEFIKDRNFYLTNSGVLKRLGYYTKGHIVARDEETDLAIIRLDGLPETAREIDWNSTAPATTASELVYILGNPGGQDLWRWTLGEFLKDHGDFLHIQSDVFGGNSGGPVLNKQGVLIGIVARSDRHMNALAIPVRDISKLLSKSQLKHSRSRR